MDVHTHSKIINTSMGEMHMKCRDMKKVERSEGRVLALPVKFYFLGKKRDIRRIFGWDRCLCCIIF